eukprot:m.130652 g.130652  ORF g.130652 m.130652 type:complete len:866 (-) comp15880_c0_seq1:49-2646(-)
MAFSAGDISTYGAVDWHNFSQWVTCFAVVTFDLEAGQAIECMQPPEACFPAKVLKSIRYLAFPDSNSGLTGDYTYTFRFRNATSKRRTALSAATAAYPTTLSASGHDVNPPETPALDDEVNAEGDFNYEATAPSSNTEAYCQCHEAPAEADQAVTSNTLAFGTCPHCQRLRHTSSPATVPSPGVSSTKPASSSSDVDCGYRQAGQAGGPKFLYGYVYFRQVPDESNRRGFFQKSIVLVTSRPLSGLFATMATHLALSYFSTGAAALASACADVSLWPPPQRGMSSSVYFLQQSIQIQLPDDMNVTSMLYAQARLTSANIELVEDQRALDLYLCLEPLLSNLQVLWELVLTSQPILVMSQTPVVTSRLVLALVSIIMPLEYHSDFRPFFTIYDPDCQRYSKLYPKIKAAKRSSRSLSEFAGAILGVTNPYFEQAYAGWPTTVRVTSMRGLPAPGRGRRLRLGSASSLGTDLRTSPIGSGNTSPVTGRRKIDPLSCLGETPSTSSPLTRSISLGRSEPMLASLVEDPNNDMFDEEDDNDGDGGDNGDVALSRPLHRAANSLNCAYVPMIDSVLSVAAIKAKTGHAPHAGSAPTSPQRIGRLKNGPRAIPPRSGSAQGRRSPLASQSAGGTGETGAVFRPVPIGGLVTKKGKPEGVTSTYKPRLESDHKMIKQLLQCPSDTVEEVIQGGHVLRRSLDKLTRTFMIPLESYFARLMPKLSAISPLKPCPELGTFNARNFLESLPSSMLLLKQTRAGDWLGLYANFLKSRNFRGWLSLRKQHANQQLLLLYVKSLLSFDLEPWAKSSSEVEIIDFLIRIRSTLEQRQDCKLELTAATLRAVHERAALLVTYLSAELQESLRISRLTDDVL